MDRRTRTTLLGLLLLAAALRFPTLGAQSYWADEAATVDVLRHPLGELLGAVRDQESTPPLYYLLAWVWTQPLGDSEAALRALSAVFGLATVPVAAAIGARLGGARAALAAAALVATSPLLVWFSQEARAYALLVLMAGASVLLLLRVLELPSRGRLLAWGACAGAALATHFFALFLVAGEVVWLAVALRADRRLLAMALAPPAVLGLALLPLALDQRSAGRASFIGEEPLGTRLAQVPKQLLVGYDAPGEVVAAVLAGLLALAALAGLRRAGGPVRALAAVAAASVLVPLLLVVAGDDYLVTRNLLAVAVPLLVLLAVGTAGLPPRAGTVVAVALATVGAATAIAVQVDDGSQRENWRDATAAFGHEATGRGRAIVVLPGSGRVAVEHYLPGARLLRRPEVVDGLVVLGVAGTSAGGRTDAPAPPGQVPGFAPPTVRRASTWSAAAYAPADPAGAAVDPGALGALGPGAVVLLQRP
ncbi:glycosyltransferase family 39 protein [Paraconexibacter algicola]|uniref:Glycosyltransferase RgtA/B/C/D-like domain-containing protein n=1 Tax=Paraconexibacter algicola TaxID=2133960 RepID=A0A2T4UFB0_9ACTN|nr:glycosyltransferase family 39 protein [Paraconexibacter algicola]PTL56469.1 hypothetical protein C7Y72_16030 [Paraconexibacter algicola]